MAREFAGIFYQSPAWRKCRAAYIAYRKSVDGGLCEDCHAEPGKIVHHIVELSPDNIGDPDVTLGFGNLRYVCMTCHNIEEHGYGAKLPERAVRYEFDQMGNVVPRQMERPPR